MSDTWALVTGASAGFGQAIAHKLAEDQFNVILTGRRSERLNDIAQKISSQYKVQTKVLSFDISDYQACEAKMTEIKNLMSKIEILVNNAGLALGVDKIQDGKISDWEEMIDTNIKGLLYMTRLVLPHMLEKNSGHIVNIGSVAGRWTYPGGAVYSATKFAVRAISESIRMDTLGKKVRVTNIEPGMAETDFSLVRLGDQAKAKKVYEGMSPLTPDDIAETVSWCVKRPKHVNIAELVIYPTDQVGVGAAYLHRNEK
jgi:3-hydroxy acid dehydrogenase/malonic semialdehyde reductase